MSTHVTLAPGADLAGFREAVRVLIARGITPDSVSWSNEAALFGDTLCGNAPPVGLPRTVHALVEEVVCHRDPSRYALLFTLIWRVRHGEPKLYEIASDPVVHRLTAMRQSVHRAIHKMHAFVRFRRTTGEDGGERFVAWFEPEHFILEATADFFVERFRSLHWSILTPIGSLTWNGTELQRGPPGQRADVPDGDAFEAGWRGYYESVFNPARANAKAMRAGMPKKYWHNLPEAAAVPALLGSAPERVAAMIRAQQEADRHR
jgi:DNA polymerase